ncbi:alpha/beta-hydrolase [Ceraceosorus guamensis]|uniref:Alpha/beta-hydrolase n=1 Tax=Ceraceosorus guamensis TaxID=1522189 RepID=A0A316WCS3_9BASI|nr:alpha/beta-hydrolase [Ceraceosorus guamensis]PWN45325.1 alpha/beta-hydrolase [Ceraceosorus guamensis]
MPHVPPSWLGALGFVASSSADSSSERTHRRQTSQASAGSMEGNDRVEKRASPAAKAGTSAPSLLRSLSSHSSRGYAAPTLGLNRHGLVTTSVGSPGTSTSAVGPSNASPEIPSAAHTAISARQFGSLARSGSPAHDESRGAWSGEAAVRRFSANANQTYLDDVEDVPSFWDFELSSDADHTAGVNPQQASTTHGKEQTGFVGAMSRLRTAMGLQPPGTNDWWTSHRVTLENALAKASEAAQSTSSGMMTAAKKGEEETAKTGKAARDTYDSDAVEITPLREQKTWEIPKHPIVLAHGLFGFSSLALGPVTINYWRGISEMLQKRGTEFIVARVPASATIEERAEALRDIIEKEFPNRDISLIGHSMGGLDCRYLISRLENKSFRVRSLTTIATPHRGSSFADFIIQQVIGEENMPRALALVKALSIPGGGGAFKQLQLGPMQKFNEATPNVDGVKYFSYGAAFQPGMFSEWRVPFGIIYEQEGANDGLVSVKSSKWGEYAGTLGANHLELIGWVNAVKSQWQRMTGGEEPFDPNRLYLQICDDLAREGF